MSQAKIRIDHRSFCQMPSSGSRSISLSVMVALKKGSRLSRKKVWFIDVCFFRRLKSKSRVPKRKFSKQLDCQIQTTIVISEKSTQNLAEFDFYLRWKDLDSKPIDWICTCAFQFWNAYSQNLFSANTIIEIENT